ncbi:MAG: helix-turn-helix domain-containing protein [Myxococcales bacterium]
MANTEGAASVALRAQAAALRVQADTLDALAGTFSPESDDLLGVAECRALGVGRDALTGAADRGELAVSRGVRGKLLVRKSELDRWLASKPYTPSPKPDAAPDLDAWDRAVRRRAVGAP